MHTHGTLSLGGSFNKPQATHMSLAVFSYIKSNMSKLRREIMQTHLVNVVFWGCSCGGGENKKENLIYYGTYTASQISFVSECERWRMTGENQKALAMICWL